MAAEAQKKLKQLAYHDYLTGLPNRLLFVEELGHAILLSSRSEKTLGVVFLDIDAFKMINDTMGHAAGDQLLIEVSKRLTKAVRKCDVVARIGGDEFVIMVENVGTIAGFENIMKKIIASFSQPFLIKEQELFVTTSLGVAVYPTDGDNAEELIQNADNAMYQAKERGKNQGMLCTPAMQQNINANLALSNQLFRARDKDELVLFYQPQVDFSTSAIIGMEALIRWNHPEQGLIYPGSFIPIAEKNGLIRPIGDWVIRTACLQNKAWQDAGLPKIPVAVNLSVLQFNNPLLALRVEEILQESGLQSQYLELEITESVIMKEVFSVVETLNALKSLGVSIAIDDFGTDYSSLQYLKQIPANKIKIAMSFVQGAIENPTDAAITQSILLLAKRMKLRVIAEGVETKKQLTFLKRSHCQEAQGYYFSKAVPANEMGTLLEKGFSF